MVNQGRISAYDTGRCVFGCADLLAKRVRRDGRASLNGRGMASRNAASGREELARFLSLRREKNWPAFPDVSLPALPPGPTSPIAAEPDSTKTSHSLSC